MNTKNNTKCVLCGKEYYYCNVCNSTDPSWMISFCSDNCRQIYNVVASYSMKKLTQEQANGKLKELDLKNENNYSEATKGLLSEINVEEKEETVEENNEEDIIEYVAEEDGETVMVEAEAPRRMSRKKKR